MNEYFDKLYINTFTVVSFAIVLAIQFAVMYKFGIKGGIAFATGISIFISFVTQIFFMWAKGMGDSRGIGHSIPFVVFSPLLFISLSLLTVYSFGLHMYIEYLKTGILNKPVFFTWSAVFIACPVIIWGVQVTRTYITELDKTENYVKASFKILHYNELPIFIETFRFKNTINGKESDITILNNGKFYPPEAIERADLWEKSEMINQSIVPEYTLIPVGSDKFYMSWYSPVEDEYYSDDFDFPYNEFKVTNYTDGLINISIQLEVFPGGKAYLYTTKEKKRLTYIKVRTKDISETEKIRLSKHIDVKEVNLKDNIFSNPVNISENRKRLDSRLKREESLFNLSFSIEVSGELKSVDIHDLRYFAYHSNYSKLTVSEPRPIPKNITLYCINTGKESAIRTYIHFDKEKLYNTIQNLLNGNEELPLEISISIKDSNEENIQVLVKGNGQSVVFSDWVVNIVRFD